MKKLLVAVLALSMFVGCSSTQEAPETQDTQETEETAVGATIEVSSETVEIPMGSLQVDWKKNVCAVVTVTSADGSSIDCSKLFFKGAVDTSKAGEIPLTLVITENDVKTEKEITLIVK